MSFFHLLFHFEAFNCALLVCVFLSCLSLVLCSQHTIVSIQFNFYCVEYPIGLNVRVFFFFRLRLMGWLNWSLVQTSVRETQTLTHRTQIYKFHSNHFLVFFFCLLHRWLAHFASIHLISISVAIKIVQMFQRILFSH